MNEEEEFAARPDAIRSGSEPSAIPSRLGGSLYPPGIERGKMLHSYAREFQTVEVNATYYRIPPPRPSGPWSGRPLLISSSS